VIRKPLSHIRHNSAAYLVLSGVLALGLAVPAAAGAATYRFKVVDLEVEQHVTWHEVFRTNNCNADYYEHTGEGGGTLKSRAFPRGRVTFKTAGGSLQPAQLRGRPFDEDEPDVVGPVVAFAQYGHWDVTFKDDPNSGCMPPESASQPDRSCDRVQERDDESWPEGILQSFLMIVGGRVRLSGGVNPLEPKQVCSDPSLVTGTVSHAVPARRDVARLIRDRDVGRISLSASKKGHLPADRLATPGAATDIVSGGADYNVRWSMTLVRLRQR
jgi:hypothetical protein